MAQDNPPTTAGPDQPQQPARHHTEASDLGEDLNELREAMQRTQTSFYERNNITGLRPDAANRISLPLMASASNRQPQKLQPACKGYRRAVIRALGRWRMAGLPTAKREAWLKSRAALQAEVSRSR